MSYDFYGLINTGAPEPLHIEPYFDDYHPAFDRDHAAGTVMVTERGYARCGNYTSNVSGIWAKCLTAVKSGYEDWCGDDRRALMATRPDIAWEVDPETLRLADLRGKRMGDISTVLHRAVDWGVEHIDELREMNPENGWGDAEGAITYLWDIARFCDQHPSATFEIWL